MSPGLPFRRRIPTPSAVDDPTWMRSITTLRDDEVDRLLRGHTPNGRRELAPLADVATAVRTRTLEEPAPVMAYPLRHALTQRATGHPSHRPRLVPVALGAFGVAGLMLAGAANALPAPVQNVVANAGDIVGVAIPHSSEDDNVVDTSGDGRGNGGNGATEVESPDAKSGPPESTPGGATPADPGTPGDHEPATPAIPPEQSNGGNDNGTGPDPEVTETNQGNNGGANNGGANNTNNGGTNKGKRGGATESGDDGTDANTDGD